MLVNHLSLLGFMGFEIVITLSRRIMGTTACYIIRYSATFVSLGKIPSTSARYPDFPAVYRISNLISLQPNGTGSSVTHRNPSNMPGLCSF